MKPVSPLQRAVAHMNLTEYDLAIAEQNEAIRQNPKHVTAYYDRGISHYFLDHQEVACRDLHIACALGLDNGCIQVRLACTVEEEPEPLSTLPAESPRAATPRLQGR